MTGSDLCFSRTTLAALWAKWRQGDYLKGYFNNLGKRLCSRVGEKWSYTD